MSAIDKPLVKAQGVIAPQYYNEITQEFEYLTGRDGANSFIERGRVVKDVINGTTNVSKTYTNNMYGLGIVNDGANDITVTVGAHTIIVKSNESFDDLFDPFTSVTITATNSYRAVVRQ